MSVYKLPFLISVGSNFGGIVAYVVLEREEYVSDGLAEQVSVIQVSTDP